MTAFIDSLITMEDMLIEVTRMPQEGKEYYSTEWTNIKNDKYYTSIHTHCFSYAGKYLRQDGAYSVFLNSNNEDVWVFHDLKTAFCAIENIPDITKLRIAVKNEVVCTPQEGRYYYVALYTEIIGKGNDDARYFTTNPLKYLGLYTGSRVEGWGKNMKEWSHFMNIGNREHIILHDERTAFYHIPVVCPTKIIPLCAACNKLGHRIHTCPDDKKREGFYAAQKPKPIKEIKVVRTPIEGNFYEATFWERKEGHWPNETHYIKETTPREFVGQYIRHEQQGYGDGADHWAVFILSGEEKRIEYDYNGKRAWYEVEPRFI